MLVKATLEDVKKYGDFAYSLALDPERSAYPTYCDGIKTKSDFLAAAESAVKDEASELLLFYLDGSVEGWISFFWIEEDRYFQLSGFNIARGTDVALTELMNLVATEFSGYTAYFGFPADNRSATDFLARHGFECIGSDLNHSFFFDDFTPKECSPCALEIGRHNFDLFRAVYRPDPETYWNADRIFEAVDNWTIFVYMQENEPLATVFSTGKGECREVFGAEFRGGVFNGEMFCELLMRTLSECKNTGAKHLTYLCGKTESKTLTALGFRLVGEYVLYIKEF